MSQESMKHLKLDGITDELGVLLHDLLDLFLLDVFGLILLQVEDDLRTATKGLSMVRSNGERTSGRGLKKGKNNCEYYVILKIRF